MQNKRYCCFIQAEKEYYKLPVSTPFICPCDRKKIISCVIKRKYLWFRQVSDFNVYIFSRFITYESFASSVD